MFAMNNQRCLSLSIASEDCMSSTVFFAFERKPILYGLRENRGFVLFYCHSNLCAQSTTSMNGAGAIALAHASHFIFDYLYFYGFVASHCDILHNLQIKRSLLWIHFVCTSEWETRHRWTFVEFDWRLQIQLLLLMLFLFFLWWGRNSYEDLRKFTLITILRFAFVYRYLQSKAK